MSTMGSSDELMEKKKKGEEMGMGKIGSASFSGSLLNPGNNARCTGSRSRFLTYCRVSHKVLVGRL